MIEHLTKALTSTTIEEREHLLEYLRRSSTKYDKEIETDKATLVAEKAQGLPLRMGLATKVAVLSGRRAESIEHLGNLIQVIEGMKTPDPEQSSTDARDYCTSCGGHGYFGNCGGMDECPTCSGTGEPQTR